MNLQTIRLRQFELASQTRKSQGEIANHSLFNHSLSNHSFAKHFPESEQEFASEQINAQTFDQEKLIV